MDSIKLAILMGWTFLVLSVACLAQGNTVFIQDVLPAGESPQLDLTDCLPISLAVDGNLRPDCLERSAYTGLSGYGTEPLVRIRFSGPVNAATLPGNVWIVWGQQIGMLGFPTYPVNYVMPVNQLAWDPATNTFYAKPDEPLDMARKYTVLVTDGIKDPRGQPVAAGTPFFSFSSPLASLFPGQRLLAGRDFQTLDVAAWTRELSFIASARRPAPPRIFDLNDATKIILRSQTSANPNSPLTEIEFPAEASLLRQLGLRRVAFSSYSSPQVPRIGAIAPPQQIHFLIWLPNTPPPPGGYPVVFAGHGLNDSLVGGPTLFASGLVANSAVVAISAVGHGFGPNSVLRFQLKDGSNIDFPNPGRGVDLDGDGLIGSSEGCVVAGPGRPNFIRDCLRQTAVDYLQLMREIEQGIDFDNDGQPDLNPNQVKYIGQSLGAMYGAIFAALEPNLESAVLNVGGSSAVETARYSTAFQPLLRQYFRSTYPQLLLADGSLADPLPRRHQPVQILGDPKNGPTLEALDRALALEADAAPASFATLLKQGTLVGQPIKRVLYQYALGDQTIPNIPNGQLIRAGYEYELVSVYRHDLARGIVPSLPPDPHAYLAAFANPDAPSLAIGLSALAQAAQFLASGRREVPDANQLIRLVFGVNLFETPIILP